ncbi:MAG: hypothetical protein M5U14_07075 [Acidimicrobiia bacterium]|nr:hypothetical protein [Acidimicrobiia bacterium]
MTAGAALARQSRQAQGLPPTIDQPDALARIAAVLMGSHKTYRQVREAVRHGAVPEPVEEDR